ncbi:MAG TPA: hypothetical protein VFS77_18285 [Pyrinomonadaceae bacterium]|nr:hypothetical protein [Pyrinomonadaceae bacterium]
MDQKRRKGFRTIAALLLLSIAQVGLQVGLAEPASNTALSIEPQATGRLTTRNNQPIQVNGLSAANGASILSGAVLETGADQSATVNLGSLGTVDISPNTRLTLTFDDQGNFKALVTQGCVILTARTNATAELATEQGSQGKTNPATGGVLEMCAQPGAAPVVGPGVAANAGAGAGAATGGATAAGGGGLFGLGVPATIAIVSAGTAAALTPLFFQDNPSGATN